MPRGAGYGSMKPKGIKKKTKKVKKK